MRSAPKAIGVLSPQLSGDYFGTLFTGIHAVTRRHAPRLIAIQGTPRDIFPSRLAWDQVDGWIVINNADGLAQVAPPGVPLVTIGAQVSGLDCPAVFPDNRGGMHAATAHLIEHGHGRIAFVGNLGNHDIQQRYEGYQAALAEGGVALDPALVAPVADNSDISGATAFQRLLAAGLSFAAIIVATDENALGVMAAAQAAGYRVPEDLAVVSFDDIILAHSATPSLTTVRLPIRALGSSAAELLLAQIAGQEVPRGATYVPTALIRRRSCGCVTTIPAPATAGAAASDWREALAQQLAQAARHPLPVDPAISLREIWPGGETLIDALADAIQGAGEVSTAALHEAWRQAVALTENVETLLLLVDLLAVAGDRQIASMPDAAAQARVEVLLKRARLELLRARLVPEGAFLRSYASLVQQNYQVGITLLTGEAGDARQLAWLRQTPLSWACLGLWDDAGNDRAALVVAGSYCRDGGASPVAPLGSRCYAPAFPPDELILASVREKGDEMLALLPIQTAGHRWGVLALAASIEYLRGSGNYDVLNALATLLGAAMQRDELQQTLRGAYERERALANIVRELGSPVIPLLPGVLLIPLIGAIDSDRAQQIIESVLQGVSSHQATDVLLDITGVPLVDTQVANSLLQTARAATLLGARVTLVGVRPEIAQSIIGLGIDLHHLATQPTLAAALKSLLNDRRRSVQPVPDEPGT
jgi:DNA-binding LacI/PurR family transcriptional regulator/anti-anti-sigma regulatory factor